MAGQHGYRTKQVRLVMLLILVCLAAGLVRRVTLFPRFLPSTNRQLVQPSLNPDPPTVHLNPIHGRWEAVRASLGLPPLTHGVALPPGPDSALSSRSDKRASRFDLGSKRRAGEPTRQLPRLHFAPDTQPAVAAVF